MLRVNNLKKSLGNKTILDDLSFMAEPSLLTVIEGQNGAGKSTLFNIIAGFAKKDQGEIKLNDIQIDLLSSVERASQIALLMQDPKMGTIASFTIYENFAVTLLKNTVASLRKAVSLAVKEAVKNHLESLGLCFENELDRPLSNFSGGQRQLLAFAMATITKPKLLLLDEPTAALDEKSSHILMQLVKRLCVEWEIPAVIISHDYELNRCYGDRILTLSKGKIA